MQAGLTSSPLGRLVDAWWTHPSLLCFDPHMETTGPAHTVLLDPFWVSRRADQFDEVCC
ncbi:hypothetical protein GCM10018785_24060 [Streptomyces longispororuber]|uniref:Uncharacterized protein n=2 Tax=Streptomyces TaxID=1883 RepID=A0A919DLA4_9ACTN|nr:hypothetical protein GCM10018785_24060 [Streptomyces longispororuber]